MYELGGVYLPLTELYEDPCFGRAFIPRAVLPVSAEELNVFSAPKNMFFFSPTVLRGCLA